MEANNQNIQNQDNAVEQEDELFPERNQDPHNPNDPDFEKDRPYANNISE